MNAQQTVNVDAVLQALSSWGLGDLWPLLSPQEINMLGHMLTDHNLGEKTVADMYPEARERLGWMAQTCGLDPATGEQAKAEA